MVRCTGSAIALIAGLGAASAAVAEVPTRLEARGAAIRVQKVAGGLGNPWAVAPLPDGRVLVTERNAGRLRIVTPEGRMSAPVAGVPAVFRYEGPTHRSQAGLFDVKLHPDFASNREIFLSYARKTDRGVALAITRARLDERGNAARLTNAREIFVLKPADQESSGLHFGGRMTLDRDRQHMFLSIGDRRDIGRSQDTADQAGKILRMTLDGRPASAARWPGSEHDDTGEPLPPDPYVHAIGNRNSQAIAVHPQTGALWSVDHGPKGGDRVDMVPVNVNLGWPYYTAGRDYSGAPIGERSVPRGMQAPAHVFDETVAPSGALFYTGAMFGAWRDSLIVGGLYNEALMRITTGAGGRVANVEKIKVGRRVRDVAQGGDGAIWLVTDHEDGDLLRLTPSGGGAASAQ